MKITNPALKYYGGKFRLASWILKYFPKHITKTAWRRGKGFKSPMKYINLENLYAVAERLYNVQIENRDAMKLIVEMDSPETLFYLDPPYPASTRTDKNRYAFELSDRNHVELGVLAQTVKGFVIISGYDCGLYRELFDEKGWQRIDRPTLANGGIHRTESLWLSPRTASAISA